jgi:hypothetical protein
LRHQSMRGAAKFNLADHARDPPNVSEVDNVFAP